MEPGSPMPHSNNPYPDPISRINTYFFKIHSNIYGKHFQVLGYAVLLLECSICFITFSDMLHYFTLR